MSRQTTKNSQPGPAPFRFDRIRAGAPGNLERADNADLDGGLPYRGFVDQPVG